MGPRYKVTGCFRFFLFLLIFVPAVFFGAAYMRGENGVQIIKDFYHQLIGQNPAASSKDQQKDDTMPVEELREKLEEAEEEIRDLKRQLKEKEDELEALKSGGSSKQ